MPVFSFFCGSEHETSRICRVGKRPEQIDCEVCEAPAKYRLTVSTSQSLTPESHKQSRRFSGLSLHDFKCRECDHVFEEIVDHSGNETVNDGKPCPECGQNAGWLPGARIDRWSERFPYYDRGLGVMLKSKQHRRDICKARGITPVDGDWDVEKVAGEKLREEEKLLKGYDDYCDRLENHPAFASYRRARDRGMI